MKKLVWLIAFSILLPKNIWADELPIMPNENIVMIDDITNISMHTDDAADYLSFESKIKPVVENKPEQLIVSFPKANLFTVYNQDITSNFVNRLWTETNASQSSIILELKQPVDFEQTLSGMKITKPTYQNISYDGKSIVLHKIDSVQFNLEDIVENDEYYNGKYTLTMPFDCTEWLGNGKYKNFAPKFSSIEITHDKLVIHENAIMQYKITEDEQNIYITPGKYKLSIVLDPGHGGSDPGTKNGSVMEKNLTLSIVKKAIETFAGDDVRVYTTRMNDKFVSLDERVKIGNEIGDVFVSVHINSGDKNKNANGTEVYYYPHKTDKLPSKKLADTLQKKLLTSLQSTDRKVKSEAFVVIKKSIIPAALCEVGFITNSAELVKLCNDDYQIRTALAIHDAIIEFTNALVLQ